MEQPPLASDLPVLKEVGGSIIEYCTPGSAPSGPRARSRLAERASRVTGALARPPRSRSGAARRFTWAQFASRVAQVYRQVAAEADLMPIRTSA